MSDEITSDGAEEAVEESSEEPAEELSFEEQLQAAAGAEEEEEEEEPEPKTKPKPKAKESPKKEEPEYATERERELADQVKGLVGIKQGLKSQVDQQNERLAAVMNELIRLRQDLTPPEEPKEEEPDEFLDRKLDEKLDPLLRAEDERQVNEASLFIKSHIDTTTAAAREAHADYDEATAWLAQREVEDYRENNPEITDAQLDRAWKDHLMDLRVFHARRGTSMADYLYKRAKRWGFQGGEAEAAPKPGSKKVEQVRERVNKARPAPVGARTQRSPELTKEDMAHMKPEEFDRLMEEEDGFEKLLQVAAKRG